MTLNKPPCWRSRQSGVRRHWTRPATPAVIAVFASAFLVPVAPPATAQSRGIEVVAPTLPPRQPSAASAPSAAPDGAQAGHIGSSGGASQGQVRNAPGQPTHGAGHGASGWGSPGAAPSSLASSRAATAYGGYETAAAAAAAPLAATRSAATGNCRADLSPDRQTVSLMGADALPRQHVALGEFRAQRVIHSPDGRWAVALVKLRGRPQYAAMTFDLARCAAANSVDLPGEPIDARFEGDEVIVHVGREQRRVALVSPRIR